jgi:hypothetical protein
MVRAMTRIDHHNSRPIDFSRVVNQTTLVDDNVGHEYGDIAVPVDRLVTLQLHSLLHIDPFSVGRVKVPADPVCRHFLYFD